MGANYWGKYSTPRLVSYRNDLNQKWFVKFDWTPHGGKLKTKQLRGEINDYKTVKGRLKEAAEYIKDLIEWLEKDDWNPDTGARKFKTKTPQEQWQYKTLDQALNEALEIKKSDMAADSYKQYNIDVRRFIESYMKLGEVMLVKDCRPSMIKRILDNYQSYSDCSNKSYNRMHNYVKSVFSEIAIQADLLGNPAKGIKRKRVAESEGFKFPNQYEQELIKATIKDYSLGMLAAVQFVYDNGLRPKEVLKLKFKDLVELEDGLWIKLLPVVEDENSKTLNIRYIPVSESLKQRLDLDSPPDWYIFGTTFNKNRDINKRYIPSPHPMDRPTFSYDWRRIVIKGLGIDANLYGEKHKGSNDRYEAGVSLDSNRMMMGHTSKKTTSIYTKVAMKNVAAKEIRSKSPDF